jgi:hypothetical protein
MVTSFLGLLKLLAGLDNARDMGAGGGLQFTVVVIFHVENDKALRL